MQCNVLFYQGLVEPILMLCKRSSESSLTTTLCLEVIPGALAARKLVPVYEETIS